MYHKCSQEMESALEMCGIRITSYVSNISSKSIQKIIDSIVDGSDDMDQLKELAHSRIGNKHRERKEEMELL